VLSDDASAFLDAIGTRGGSLVTLDGACLVELGPEAAGLGVRVDMLDRLDAAPPRYGDLLAEDADAFTFLAEAFAASPVVVTVPPRVRLEAPIVVVHQLGPASAGRLSCPRTFVSLGELAEVTVVELLVSGDEELLVVPATELDLADGARCTYLGVQQLGRRAWQLGYQASRLGRDAVLHTFIAALGGAYARVCTRSTLAGDASESQMLAIYFGDGDQTQDFRTFQEHVAPRTRSELVFKGAVADRARSVYSGLVHMHKGARRADASQTNRNLVLSEDAHADSVPNLDIEENDVRCSHASAVGPVDSEQRFYLESRGIPPEVAERLILLGFFEDLLVRSPHQGYAAYLHDIVSARVTAAATSAPAGAAVETTDGLTVEQA